MPFFKRSPKNNINVRQFDNPQPLSEAIEKISRERLLQQRLKRHHGMYVCPPKSTSLENIFVNIFDEDFGFGQEVNGVIFDWYPESHKVGADLTVPSISTSRISIKTGCASKIGRKAPSNDIRNDHRIEFSSFRLTTHPDLEAIKCFLQKQHQDVTFLLSPYEKRGIYVWTVLENIDFSNLMWRDKFNTKGSHSGWIAEDEGQGLIKAEIKKGLSTQLWIEMKLSSNRIIHVEEICD